MTAMPHAPSPTKALPSGPTQASAHATSIQAHATSAATAAAIAAAANMHVHSNGNANVSINVNTDRNVPIAPAPTVVIAPRGVRIPAVPVTSHMTVPLTATTTAMTNPAMTGGVGIALSTQKRKFAETTYASSSSASSFSSAWSTSSSAASITPSSMPLQTQQRPRSQPTRSQTMTSTMAKRTSRTTPLAPPPPAPQSPSLFISKMYSDSGLAIQPARDQAYFVEPTAAMIEAYDKDILSAVRHKNLQMLRDLHQQGKQLQCCNRFGESLIHMACRNGLTDIVKFLVQEAGVSLFVRDDYGRTPAHDACWTVKPNLDLMDFLMQEAPQLLGLSDVRGHTPFAYARRDHWAVWMGFLTQRRHLIIPSKPRRVSASSICTTVTTSAAANAAMSARAAQLSAAAASRANPQLTGVATR